MGTMSALLLEAFFGRVRKCMGLGLRVILLLVGRCIGVIGGRWI
jgi:hypothetical protein